MRYAYRGNSENAISVPERKGVMAEIPKIEVDLDDLFDSRTGEHTCPFQVRDMGILVTGRL